MADIFLSYDRADRISAKRLADVLVAQGLTVWWDPSLVPGDNFRAVLAQELHAARCIIVLWSAESVKSNWVIDEATDGLNRGVLIQATITRIDPPHGFRSYQRADLTRWDGSTAAPEFRDLLAGISKVLGRGHVPQVLQPTLSAGDSEPTRPSHGKVRDLLRTSMSRRNLLLSSAALLVPAIAWYWSTLTRGIWRIAPRSWRPTSHASHPSRNRRLARNRQPLWTEKLLVANVATKPATIHWPHPDLFKARYHVAPDNQVLIDPDAFGRFFEGYERNRATKPWAQLDLSVHERPAKASLSPQVLSSPEELARFADKYGGVRLNRSQAESILERLALRRLDRSAATAAPSSIVADVAGLDSALALLRAAKSSAPETRRTHELAARLICLRNHDPETAARQVLNWLGPINTQATWSLRLRDPIQFRTYHRRTLDVSPNGFMSTLKIRIAAAQRL